MVDAAVEARKKADRPTIDSKYRRLGPIGEGTYGVVYKAVVLDAEGKETDQLVAIKKLLRELSLDSLRHENVVYLRDVYVEPEERSLYLVFEYSEYDFFELVKANFHRSMPPMMVKSLMYQLISGIYFLHSNWIMHRDLKPSNILVMGDGPEEGVVKIADFGLARIFQAPLRRLSKDGPVVTIWYRAPELLLGANHYTRAVDMWAVGAIFAELLMSKPLFNSGTEKRSAREMTRAQLDVIFKRLGTPSPARWTTLEQLPDWPTYREELPRYQGYSIEQLLDRCQDKNAIDLVTRLLEYDPVKRISAKEALDHKYFKETIYRNSFIIDQRGTRAEKPPGRKIKPVKNPDGSRGAPAGNAAGKAAKPAGAAVAAVNASAGAMAASVTAAAVPTGHKRPAPDTLPAGAPASKVSRNN